MDNLFEILIYVLIIISFLSSFFKKKKQEQQKPSSRQSQTEEYHQPEIKTHQTQPKEEYDILRELEDFFKVGDEPAERKTHLPQSQSETMPELEEHTKSESWQTQTKSEHVADDWERKRGEVQKILAGVDSAIEKKAALFEESLYTKERVHDTFALAVKSKLMNPSTLKEYIIFSEILGKPKALRR